MRRDFSQALRAKTGSRPVGRATVKRDAKNSGDTVGGDCGTESGWIVSVPAKFIEHQHAVTEFGWCPGNSQKRFELPLDLPPTGSGTRGKQTEFGDVR